MIFSSASHEEFRLGFSTVPFAPPGVSADPCVVAVPERHGLSCFFGFINDKIKIFLVCEISYGTNNITRHFWNLARGKTFARKDHSVRKRLSLSDIFSLYMYALRKPEYYLCLES